MIPWMNGPATNTEAIISACVSAALRLSTSAGNFWNEDLTYTSSWNACWSIFEMVCAILVFCIPAFPKAFQEEAFITRFLALLVTRTIAFKKPKAQITGTETDSGHRLSRLDRTYYSRIDDGSLLAPLGSNATTIGEDLESQQRNGDIDVPRRAIVCTTTFEARVEPREFMISDTARVSET